MAGSSPLSGQSVDSLLINLSEVFDGLKGLLLGVNGNIGLIELTGQFLIAVALFQAWKASSGNMSGGQVGAGKIFSPLIIGALFVSWGNTTNMVAESLALTGSAVGYLPEKTTGYSEQVLKAAFSIIGVLGMIAIFRGLLKWKRAGEGYAQGGDDLVWGGLWHIIGGGIAMRLGAFMQMLGF